MGSSYTVTEPVWTTSDELCWLYKLNLKGNFGAIRNYVLLLRAGMRSFDTHVDPAAVLTEAEWLLGERGQCRVELSEKES